MSVDIIGTVAQELGSLTIQLIQSKANYTALEVRYKDKEAALAQLQAQFTDVSNTSQSIIARMRNKIEALTSEVLTLRAAVNSPEPDEPLVMIVQPTDTNIDLPESVKDKVNSASDMKPHQSEDK